MFTYSTYIYSLTPPSFIQFPLLIGSPDSAFPVPELEGCKHCTPVLYYPAHCELHFHLREFIPKHLNFCSACGKYTRYEAKGFSDSHEVSRWENTSLFHYLWSIFLGLQDQILHHIFIIFRKSLLTFCSTDLRQVWDSVSAEVWERKEDAWYVEAWWETRKAV